MFTAYTEVRATLSNLGSLCCYNCDKLLTLRVHLSDVYCNLVSHLSCFTIIGWYDADHCVSAWSGSCSGWETRLWRADRDCSHMLGNSPAICPSLFQPLYWCSHQVAGVVAVLSLTQRTMPTGVMMLLIVDALIASLFTVQTAVLTCGVFRDESLSPRCLAHFSSVNPKAWDCNDFFTGIKWSETGREWFQIFGCQTQGIKHGNRSDVSGVNLRSLWPDRRC